MIVLGDIQTAYTAAVHAINGSKEISEGMTLNSDVNTTTHLLDCANYNTDLGTKTSNSTASVTLACGTVNHTIFAIDGYVCEENPINCAFNVTVCAPPR